SVEDRLEKAGGLMSEYEKIEGENEVDLNVNKRSVDGGKQGSSVKKLKKDKIVGTDRQKCSLGDEHCIHGTSSETRAYVARIVFT
ncbi:hypothetical protein FRX31_013198, partial [Thalictrum thalictroides]